MSVVLLLAAIASYRFVTTEVADGEEWDENVVEWSGDVGWPA